MARGSPKGAVGAPKSLEKHWFGKRLSVSPVRSSHAPKALKNALKHCRFLMLRGMDSKTLVEPSEIKRFSYSHRRYSDLAIPMVGRLANPQKYHFKPENLQSDCTTPFLTSSGAGWPGKSLQTLSCSSYSGGARTGPGIDSNACNTLQNQTIPRGPGPCRPPLIPPGAGRRARGLGAGVVFLFPC